MKMLDRAHIIPRASSQRNIWGTMHQQSSRKICYSSFAMALCYMCRCRRSTWCRNTSAAARAMPELSKLGGTRLGRKKERVQEAVQRHGRGHDPDPGDAGKRRRASRSRPIRSGRRSSKRPSPIRRRPTRFTAIAEIKGDLEQGPADGPLALRRRRLRQNGGGHPRRLQGGRQRQAGGHPGADDGARRTALPHLLAAVGGLSVHRRSGQPLPFAGRAEGNPEAGRARAKSTSSSARTGWFRRT